MGGALVQYLREKGESRSVHIIASHPPSFLLHSPYSIDPISDGMHAGVEEVERAVDPVPHNKEVLCLQGESSIWDREMQRCSPAPGAG